MNTRESLLVAQLSKATIDFLSVLNRKRRDTPRVKEMIAPIMVEARYNQHNSLINQGTLLGHAYLTMVWLWEQQSETIRNTVPNQPLNNPVTPWPNLSDTVLQWETGFKTPSPQNLHHWLQHIRNALSHGRVSFDPVDNDMLVFADASNSSSAPHTQIRLSPEQLGHIADIVITVCEQGKAQG